MSAERKRAPELDKNGVQRLVRERDEALAGYEQLDKKWHAIHEGAMGAIRRAAGDPGATVPEIVEALRGARPDPEKRAALVRAIRAITDNDGAWLREIIGPDECGNDATDEALAALYRLNERAREFFGESFREGDHG